MNFTVQQIDATLAVKLILGDQTLGLTLQQQQQTFPIVLDPDTPATLDFVVAGAINLAIATPGSIQTTFIFTQAVPALHWDINHNLQRYPSVSVVDSSGSTVEGDINYVNANEISLTFAAGFSGVAYLN